MIREAKQMGFASDWRFELCSEFLGRPLLPANKNVISKERWPHPTKQVASIEQVLKLDENLESQRCLWDFKHPSHHDLKTDVGVSSKKPGLSKDSVKQSYDTLRHRFRKVSSSRSVSWSYYWYYEQLFVSNISYLCSVNKYKGYQFYAKKGSGSFKLIYRSEIYKISTLLHFTCIYTQIA